MNVNWDEVAYKAENSPRAVLAEYLAMADDLRSVIVVTVKNADAEGDSYSYNSSGSRFEVIGLLRAALRHLESGFDGDHEE